MAQYRTLDPGKVINPDKLTDELVAAAIQCTGSISYASATSITIEYTDLATSTQMNANTDTVITAHNAVSLSGGVNGKVTGSKAIVYIPATATRVFLPTLIRLAVTSNSTGITTPPTISIGSNSPAFDNVMAAVALATLNLTAANRLRNVLLGTTTHTFMLTALTTVYINVSIAAIATVYNLGIKIEGDWLDL